MNMIQAWNCQSSQTVMKAMMAMTEIGKVVVGSAQNAQMAVRVVDLAPQASSLVGVSLP